MTFTETNLSSNKAFPRMLNTNYLKAALGEVICPPPVWVMRQAGRYLPEFREVREKYDFFKVCQTPELACQITLQPIDRYDGLLDAAIIFSDILVIPQAMGMEVQMLPSKGPHFPCPLISPEDLNKLRMPVVKDVLSYVFEAITLTRHRLNGRVPLIGFSGAPWTLMAYMIEGGGSKTFSKAKAWLYRYPSESKQLLAKLSSVIADYIVEQVLAGAQAIQLFDSWAGELSPKLYKEFGIPFLEEIVTVFRKKLIDAQITERIPLTLFCKGAHSSLKDLSDLDIDVLGLDYTMEAIEASKNITKRICLQGNLDPCALFAETETLKELTNENLKEFDSVGLPHIVNLGHGM
ncbi:uroporphyrinogen decarboxylase-like protein [Rozella allomycis CSF55]|uniref:Uroporphyrinogen decarboxylase n=1 Tax=Rozella allomycis (strain CSF55) TaxID=988480 RepID=A0A4P9YJ49_ROZAC|nr:uroporphyrinogen decarboxylase-like protein [Rozella allomycis CSF55]